MNVDTVVLAGVVVSQFALLVIALRSPQQFRGFSRRWGSIGPSLMALGMVGLLVGSLARNEWATAALAGASLVAIVLLVLAVATSRGDEDGAR